MSEVYYVERDGNGAVVAIYGVPQPGITDPEPLPETDPEVAAILNPPPQPEPEPGPPEIDDYRRAVQAHIDATAQERQYDGGHTCATYIGSTNPQWAAEAQAFVAWRDAVWAYAFAELGKVQGGQRAQPTVADFVAEVQAALPMEWPE